MQKNERDAIERRIEHACTARGHGALLTKLDALDSSGICSVDKSIADNMLAAPNADYRPTSAQRGFEVHRPHVQGLSAFETEGKW